MPPSLSDLPSELWQKIATHASEPDNHCVPRRDLQSCMLVCKFFSTIFTPHLYHLARISNTRQLQQRFQHLSRNPAHAQYVTALELLRADEVVQSDVLPAFLDLLVGVPRSGAGIIVEVVIRSSLRGQVDLLQLPEGHAEALARICTLRSIARLELDGCFNFPPDILGMRASTVLGAVTFGAQRTGPAPSVPAPVAPSDERFKRRMAIRWLGTSASTFLTAMQVDRKSCSNISGLAVHIARDRHAWKAMECMVQRSAASGHLEELSIFVDKGVDTSLLEDVHLDLAHANKFRRIALTVSSPPNLQIPAFLARMLIEPLFSKLKGTRGEDSTLSLKTVEIEFDSPRGRSLDEVLDPRGWAELEGVLLQFPALKMVKVSFRFSGNKIYQTVDPPPRLVGLVDARVQSMLPLIPRSILQVKWSLDKGM
ncbi:hypothetical protein CC1G_02675 [Coprinopsis cinerea okayama7|uniref:Uncharacterized protein n=1 Tax=Coprinopsis cinerea (strain Okayama-7 / 130 / ATCC MYA-4618 / FGSC 9003) TaxID=240176 RepID=A8PBL4_COPC7|nr:hypothetical protein CC1G_02675 [Coprinopsis cinerea okayama7\|eukprot:XP_001840212.1 hypothetical protein CC1G_02675 [Coprinopsis cinerea okayama7\